MTKRLATGVLFVVSVCLLSAAFQVTMPIPVSKAANSSLLGVYYGNQGWAMDDVAAMEQWQGKKNAVVNMFTNWCDRTKTIKDVFDQQLPNIWNNGNVPMITWEPFLCSSAQTPDDVEVRASNGEYDSYLNTWADRLKGFLAGPDGTFGTSDDRRAYIRMGHEMNGDWYQWGAAVGNNLPSDFVNMWIHVWNIFDAKGLGASHIQWVWAPNHTDCGGFTAEEYWPGDAYVDWVGIDGYNWGTTQTWSSWKSPAETYDDMLGRVRALTSLPVTLSEFASTSEGGDKGVWITDVFNYVLTNDIRMVAWFNEDKETDWAVYGGSTTWSEYATAVGDAAFISSSLTNPRLLTDGQFAGTDLSGGGPDPTDTPVPTPTSENTPTPTPTPGGGSGGAMHVSDITMGVKQTGPQWQATALVTVVDDVGNPVEGATVYGSWSGLVSGGDGTKTTDASGVAGPFYSNRTKSSGTITFCVDNITKDGYTYADTANVETCDSISN